MPLSMAIASEPSSFVARPLVEARGLAAVRPSATGARAALSWRAERGGVCLTVDQGDGRLGHERARSGVPAQPAETAIQIPPTTSSQPRQAKLISIPRRL